MSTRTRFLLVFTLITVLIGNGPFQSPALADDSFEFKAMTWNIWRGGREDGKDIGPARVIEVIRESKADIIAMQETYGSGELIAKELGFHFQPRGTNVSIFSRFPIVEDISVFEEFKCVGAIVQLPNDQQIAFYSIWLPYAKEIWEEGTRKPDDVDSWLAACAPSAVDLKVIRDAIDERLSDSKYSGIPVMIAGDFNSMSHLDYTSVARSEYGGIVQWPTSQVMTDHGYRDTWRELHPTIDRAKDRTWTPRFPKQEQDRIDFIYYRGDRLEAIDSSLMDQHAELFPSDHAALLATFRCQKTPASSDSSELKVLCYNIRRCLGTDNKTDTQRTIDAIAKYGDLDFIGLQEVDVECQRSGSINQPREFGAALNMHSSFGSFFELQGGRYGLAILSKHPIYRAEEVVLPEGNERRVALAAEVRLPSGERILVVNVHFDWVQDDQFRFAQASELRKYLSEQKLPYVLLGDFNDTPESRTLALFQDDLLAAKKPETDRFTFSSEHPRVEIDFIFASPTSRWEFQEVKVGDDSVTSDHRPVFARLTLSK